MSKPVYCRSRSEFFHLAGSGGGQYVKPGYYVFNETTDKWEFQVSKSPRHPFNRPFPEPNHGKVLKKAQHLDIGDGYVVIRRGMDVNGNHCVWVRCPRTTKAIAIQTNGALPTTHHVLRSTGLLTDAVADEIKAYCHRYLLKK